MNGVISIYYHGEFVMYNSIPKYTKILKIELSNGLSKKTYYQCYNNNKIKRFQKTCYLNF